MKRPSVITSRVATCSATSTGFSSGSRITVAPTRIGPASAARRARAGRLCTSWNGVERKCWPITMRSKPASRAARTWSMCSRKRSTMDTPEGCCLETIRPKFMSLLDGHGDGLTRPVEVGAAPGRAAHHRDLKAPRVLDDGHRQVRVVPEPAQLGMRRVHGRALLVEHQRAEGDARGIVHGVLDALAPPALAGEDLRVLGAHEHRVVLLLGRLVAR